MIDLLFTLFPLGCLAGAFILLIVLCVIDLKYFLLLNIYVFPFGMLGVLFHASTGFGLLTPQDIVLGAVVGGGILLVVRAAGNAYYKQDSLGLGDVKLLAAAGLWLGPVSVTIAMTLGAAAGLIHGLGVAAYHYFILHKPFTIKRLVIPAGPGFIIGIVATILYDYGIFIRTLFLELMR